MSSTGTGLPDWRVLQLVEEARAISARLKEINNEESEEYQELHTRRAEIVDGLTQ